MLADWLTGWLAAVLSMRQHGSVCSQSTRPPPASFTAFFGLSVRNKCPIVLHVFFLPIFYFYCSVRCSKNILFALRNIYGPAANVALHSLKHIKAGGAADLPSFRRICLCFELVQKEPLCCIYGGGQLHIGAWACFFYW